MYLSGTWAFNSLSQVFEDSSDWEWAPLPSLSNDVEAGVFPLAIGTELSINVDTEKADASAAFLDYLVGDIDRALTYSARTGENPPPLAITADQFPSDIDKRAARLYSDVPQTTNLGYSTWTFLPAKTNSYLITEFDKIVTGDMTSAEYLAGLQSTFDAESADGATLAPFVPAGRVSQQ